MPVSSGSVVQMTPAMSPSGMSCTAAPALRTAAISSRVARPVEDAGGDLGDRHALRLRQRLDVGAGRGIEIDDARRIARSDGDLVHVDVGRVQKPAALGDREHRERIWHRLGADRRALERIDRDVDLRALARADLLADVKHRRFVHLAFADDDGAADRQLGELAPHGIDRDLVGGLLLPAPAQVRCRDRRGLGDARDLENQHAVEARLDASSAMTIPSPRRRSSSLSFSMRITCGRSDTLPSRSIASIACRIASSVVSCVIMTTGAGAPGFSRAPIPGNAERGRRCTMLSIETSRSPMRFAIAAMAPGRS